MSFFTVQAQSQESGEQDIGAIEDAESKFLFINMIEFLAEFETNDGEWISPDILSDDAFNDLDGGDQSADQSQRGLLSVTEEDE